MRNVRLLGVYVTLHLPNIQHSVLRRRPARGGREYDEKIMAENSNPEEEGEANSYKGAY